MGGPTGDQWRLLRGWRWNPISALAEARGILFPWVPVFLAIGIGLWFALPWEPGPTFYAMILGLGLVALTFRIAGPEAGHPFAVAVLCVVFGVLAAGARAHLVAAPVLEFRYYGPVQGRVVAIDRSQSDHLRLTLDQVVLERVAPDRVPERVRISLHGDQGFLTPEPGQMVILTGHLSGPEGPVEPGGFDFQRMAWFDRLGAVGYTRSPALLLEPPAAGAQAINRLRNHIKSAVQAQVPGEPGAFAAALVTGDRSGIGQETQQELRNANLAHLLAISGLHMGLLVGFVFAALRYGLALVPPLALRLPAKKIAAGIALAAGGFYLLMSGGNVATQRAFVMVAVMLVAVLFDRRALTLRSVAIAAILLLVLQPETLLEPGFQMSFSATVALVAGFGMLQGRFRPGAMPGWAAPVFTLVFSSAIAGFATAPYAAAHFNRFADYGLLANFLAVPLMGTLVMPSAVMAALLSPFGLEA
ncbi:MAG TPA: ComEC/Rec2 family competence protein, partial [Paracoccaceae bacterium]